MKKIILILSIILLFFAEISRVYYIMPFPGSQKSESIGFAYWMHNNLFWIRILLLLLVLIYLVPAFKRSGNIGKILFVALGIFYVVVVYFFNFRLQADKMFIQSKRIIFKNAAENTVDTNKLVIGVVVNGLAKAYPIQIIGYHHQVRDYLNNVPLMVTYCTVCRTGRVFNPAVNGKPETFRLVGMDHFNAMFEDATTKSWWRQATGLAVAGKLKGQSLKEMPSEQATLASWLRKYPESLILQPDTVFNKRYEALKKFDDGTTKDALEKRDSASWKFKSWVIGVDYSGNARAYDWNMLANQRIIQDSLPGLPLLITLENDTATYHVFNRGTKAGTLYFHKD
ncbi:MAG: DUF3179 domain-containing protein, partial [Chitinophagaceae bacterium]|nr:DUF3179 domain-containing protein [Chitinophagaceae bacterium]